MRRLAPLCTLLTACAHLSVTVDILDKNCLDDADVLAASVERELAAFRAKTGAGKFGEAPGKLRSELADFYRRLVPKGIVDSADIDQMVETAGTKIDAAIEGAEASYASAAAKAEAARRATGESRADLYLEAAALLEAGKARLRELSQAIADETDGVIADALQGLVASDRAPLVRAKDDLDRRVDGELRSLTGGLGLFDDPLADRVLHSPEACWDGVFGKTYACGALGNTDIAIKLESLGHFTIKGVRVDAAKITQATFKVLEQGIALFAAAAGVPAPAQGSATAGADTAGDEVLQAERRREQARSARRLSRLAALALLDAILAQKDALGADGTRRSAVAGVRTTFGVYRSQLDPVLDTQGERR